ncbi:MAG: InlB B-repeat-containing protein, partial [Acholeplasmataceae bacterium]|nr:InlB B-repeat-containing protein [Acholeplasmataceae bacterium]
TLATPTKEGHNFVGWYLDSEFSGEPVTQITEAKNYTLYAKWEVQSYDVTFDVEGETTVIQVQYGQTVTKPQDPVKEGYVFLGWYLEDELYDFATPVSGPITLVAQFRELTVLERAKIALLDEEIPTYFPYGKFAENKLLNHLPTSLEGFPTVTITWFGDLEEFDEDLVLKKQRMLYYETTIVATLSSPDETDMTVEFKVNIGIVEKPMPEAYGISQVSRAGATSFNVEAYNAENGFGNKFDGGTNITDRDFKRFSGLVFKSNFTWGSVTADFYLFIRAGNIFNIQDSHLVQDGDVYRITGSSSKSWAESSFARIVYNSTNKDGVIKGDQLASVLGLQEHNAYHIWIVDGQGNIVLKHTGTQPNHEYVIPAGGYIIERGYIDGSSSNTGGFTSAIVGFFQNATKVEILKFEVHNDYK